MSRWAIESLHRALEKRAAATNQHSALPGRGKLPSTGHVGVEKSVACGKLKCAMKNAGYKVAEGEMDPAAQQSAGAAPQGGAAQPSLGDPNYWSGGSQQGNPPPQDAEEAVSLLPGGTFQGLNMKVTPDGQKSVNVKVTPEALSDPDSLAQFFQTEPGMKIEIAPPDGNPAVQVQPGPQGQPGLPQDPMAAQGQGAAPAGQPQGQPMTPDSLQAMAG